MTGAKGTLNRRSRRAAVLDEDIDPPIPERHDEGTVQPADRLGAARKHRVRLHQQVDLTQPARV
jgi:hypothetical protein